MSDALHKGSQAGLEKAPFNSAAFSWFQVWTHPGSSMQHWGLTCQGWRAAPALTGQEMALAQHRGKAMFCPSWGWLYCPLSVVYTQIPHACCMHFS